MKYLVDANVLSEPTKPLPNIKVVEWLRAHEGEFVVDSIVLGELAVGIHSLTTGRKRRLLEQWFSQVEATIECVPWDAAVAISWAKLVAELKRKGHALPVLDSMIAATALTHSLTVVTRNVDHFKNARVEILNPFS